MSMQKMKWLALLAIAALALGCASAPPAPEWVLKTPAADSEYTYFVGSSSAKDSATALNDATASLVAGIMQYMGVSINVTSNAEAKASLDDYRAQVTQTVKTEANGRLVGFEVVEKYIQKNPKTAQYTVHVLARYETKELLKERARIALLLAEKNDAVAAPEQRGDVAAAEGRLLDAIRSYAEAMSAAGAVDIENAQLKLERNAKKASALAATLTLTVQSAGGGIIPVGGRLPSFSVRLATNRGGTEEGVAGVSLMVTYPRRLSSGRVGTSVSQVFTDKNGDAVFDVPAIDVAGNYRVTIQLDFISISDLLADLPSWALPYNDAIENDLSGIVTYISYQVIPRAQNVPMAVAAYNRNPAHGAKIDLTVFVDSLKESLIKEGFVVLDAKVPDIGENPSFAQVKKAAPPQAQRFVLAALDLGSVTREGDYFVATVSGTLSVLDMKSGETLYSASRSAQGIGLSENEAVDNAFKTLGEKSFAQELLGTLP